MSRDHFSVQRAATLRDISIGSKVHVIGVCGVAMAQLALALSQRGYQVSGSDKEFYEPMGSLLRRSSITLYEGYAASNISADVSLVVVGNAVSYENVEVQETERRGLAYTLFPKLLAELIIGERHSIVVSGTHGKTSTSAMGAFILSRLGRDPGYFVGGVVRDLEQSLRFGNGAESIVEGDEYDSAFFAKVPKFSFYKPRTLIVTSIEYDHADIYPDLSAIVREFEKMVSALPKGARVIGCADDPTVRELLKKWRARSDIQVISYAVREDADVRVQVIEDCDGVQRARARFLDGTELEFSLKLPGAYNVGNALAVLLALHGLGIAFVESTKALAEFCGVKRRQEIRLENQRVTLIEDFAHHPTAVRETLQGVRARYSKKTIWAIFEPRSNTSRRKVFQQAYIDAFAPANQVVLNKVVSRANDSAENLIDVSDLASAIDARGVPAVALENVDEIVAHVTKNVGNGDIVVVMSNGSFGGLIDRLVKLWG